MSGHVSRAREPPKHFGHRRHLEPWWHVSSHVQVNPHKSFKSFKSFEHVLSPVQPGLSGEPVVPGESSHARIEHRNAVRSFHSVQPFKAVGGLGRRKARARDGVHVRVSHLAVD
jgi:hypothetical protein